jgi:hypothetical protein
MFCQVRIAIHAAHRNARPHRLPPLFARNGRQSWLIRLTVYARQVERLKRVKNGLLIKYIRVKNNQHIARGRIGLHLLYARNLAQSRLNLEPALSRPARQGHAHAARNRVQNTWLRSNNPFSPHENPHPFSSKVATTLYREEELPPLLSLPDSSSIPDLLRILRLLALSSPFATYRVRLYPHILSVFTQASQRSAHLRIACLRPVVHPLAKLFNHLLGAFGRRPGWLARLLARGRMAICARQRRVHLIRLRAQCSPHLLQTLRSSASQQTELFARAA